MRTNIKYKSFDRQKRIRTVKLFKKYMLFILNISNFSGFSGFLKCVWPICAATDERHLKFTPPLLKRVAGNIE